MTKRNIVLMAALGWLILAPALHAQITNVYQTKLEAFEGRTGTVIVRSSAPMGSITADSWFITVSCKESTDASNNHKEYGVSVELREGNGPEDTTLIDYDELPSLLSGLAYIAKANYSVTSLPSFDAAYTTRGGLRIAAFSSNRRQGAIQAVIQGSHRVESRVLLAQDQLGQLQTILQQAKSKLDGLRASK